MLPRIKAFLAQHCIAIVGVSRTRGFGNAILKTLTERGYELTPVNANADTVEGRPCFRGLAHLPQPVDAAIAVVPPLQTLSVVDDCIQLGIKYLWMQQGSESQEAIKRAEAAGISVVHHACILMYAEPKGIHRFHRWIHSAFAHE
jgi:predicted CoA-binding protein